MSAEPSIIRRLALVLLLWSTLVMGLVSTSGADLPADASPLAAALDLASDRLGDAEPREADPLVPESPAAASALPGLAWVSRVQGGFPSRPLVPPFRPPTA